jgi:hypothetical protein
MNPIVTARCSCGNFQFRSARAPILQLTCHCRQCRQVSGTASTNFAFFKLAEAELEGQTTVHSFVADSGCKTVRETCASCGEPLLDRTEGFPKIVGIVAERIQPPYRFEARCHVWVRSKSAEVTIPEGAISFLRGME